MEDTGWIQTYTGRQFYPMAPLAQDICIEDIAHALSQMCRFTGHTREFYSVAQHSVLVSGIVPHDAALWGLLHDAPEAYLADVARPLKSMLPGLADAEQRIEAAVARRFSLHLPMSECIHAADLTMLATEQRDLMAPAPAPWTSIRGIEPLLSPIVPWDPCVAEWRFIDRFYILTDVEFQTREFQLGDRIVDAKFPSMRGEVLEISSMYYTIRCASGNGGLAYIPRRYARSAVAPVSPWTRSGAGHAM